MSEQESEDIGKVLKNAINEFSITPPTGVWESLRLLALQTQIAHYQNFSKWLSIYSSIITLLFGGAIYLLFMKDSASTRTKILYKNQLVNVYNNDTIFIDRVKYVYVKEKNAAILEDISTKNLAKTAELSDEENPIHQNLLSKNKPKLSADEENFTLTNNHSPLGEPNITSDPKSKSISSILTTMQLKKLDYKAINGFFSQPKIALLYTNKSNNIVKSEHIEKPKVPLKNSVSVSAFYSPEYSNLSVYRSEPEAFDYGNEQIENSHSFGLRASIDITQKLSISTGIEWANIQFASTIRRFPIQATLINGQATYLYKTVFGVATIPKEEMTTLPAIGNTITLESEDEHAVSFIRLPLSLKYTAFQWKIKKGGRSQKYISLYGIGGISYNTPYQQKLQVEIYETDGHDFHTTLGNFNNTQSFWAYNLGFGAELDLTHNASFWLEPHYNKTINSFVYDLPLKSYIYNLGLKIGLKWHF